MASSLVKIKLQALGIDVSLVSFSAPQQKIKCTSSSTSPLVHNLHILHSLGTLYHRPIFTSNGRHPALSKVISDLDLLLLTLDTKASV